MPVQKDVILNKLNANYEEIIQMLPPELAKEFKTKIISPANIQEYASTILVAMQLNDRTSMIRIENWLADRFKIGNFGRKLSQQGLNPVSVYERLLQGFFDYK
jgi:hypothetical protein